MESIVHSREEAWLEGHWYILEGVILDRSYLHQIQDNFKEKEQFCGYAIHTENLKNPPIEFNKSDSFIQDGKIHKDYGLFDSPDDFYPKHGWHP